MSCEHRAQARDLAGGRSRQRPYGILLRQQGWVKKAGASSRTPYGGSNAQAFRAAYEGVAAFVEAEEAVDILCDSDADADADFPCRSRGGPKPERALGAQIQPVEASCDSHCGGEAAGAA